MPQGMLKLTRNQLAAFLHDHKAIVQFEKLFSVVDTIAPDVVSEISTSAENARSAAQQALDALHRIADALELLALAPANDVHIPDDLTPERVETALKDDLSPPFQIGTLGEQQADRVNITGGTVTAQLRNNQTILLETTAALANGAAVGAGTLLNAPAAGDPTKWVGINDNGTTRYIPAW